MAKHIKSYLKDILHNWRLRLAELNKERNELDAQRIAVDARYGTLLGCYQAIEAILKTPKKEA